MASQGLQARDLQLWVAVFPHYGNSRGARDYRHCRADRDLRMDRPRLLQSPTPALRISRRPLLAFCRCRMAVHLHDLLPDAVFRLWSLIMIERTENATTL